MKTEDLQVIANLTVELTRLRQEHCKHLAIENFSPKLFGELIDQFLLSQLPKTPEEKPFFAAFDV